MRHGPLSLLTNWCPETLRGYNPNNTKQRTLEQQSHTKIVGTADEEASPLPIEWMQDEPSESEDFILVESRKKMREKRKKVKISPVGNTSGSKQEIPAKPKGRGRKPAKPNIIKTH